MSKRKQSESSSRHRSSARRRKRTISKRLKSIGNLILAPIKLLFLPAKAIGLFHDRGVELKDSSRSSKRKRTNATYRILSYPIKFLLLPATLYHRASKRGKKKELLFLIPAALIGLLLVFVVYKKNFRSAGLQQQYLAKARLAITDNNLVMAKTYMARILQEEETLSDAQALHWVVILGRTGEEEQAANILRRIAPDDTEGYAPAHRFAAIEIVRLNEIDRGKLDTTRLKWHLDHASEMDADLKSTWASYYVAMKQPAKAIEFLNDAAGTYPQLFLTCAKISEDNGFEEEKTKALGRAETTFKNLLKEQPLDLFSRISLVSAMVQLEKLEEAEKILKSGLAVQPVPILKRTLSDLYVVGFDKTKKVKGPFNRQLLFLKQAIAADSGALVPYHRLVALTSGQSSPKDREQLRTNFLEVVTGPTSGPIDHCSIARLHWLDSDFENVDWHLKQAWRVDPEFGEKAHHLALAFAQSRKHSDLDWSERLAAHVIKNAPNKSIYHETLGEIYLIRKEFSKSVDELKIALPNSSRPSSVHSKLAVAYNELGESRLAQTHSHKAAEGDIKLANDRK